MKKLILNLIHLYQKYLSFDSGLFKRLFVIKKTCRFIPSCSEYSYQAINKYGIILGGWKGLCRIFKCNPFNSGGIDFLK